jgi:Plasmid pRiA4b ORF-3-like protein
MAVSRKTIPRPVRTAGVPIYQLRIELQDLKPSIWRSVLVPGLIKLSKLHVVLLRTMGWMGGHLHEFIIGDAHYGEPDTDFPQTPPVLREDRNNLANSLGTLNTFRYLYDFGDGWEHKVRVEKILPPDSTARLPLCLAGANACPPEDVGGPPGYVDFIEAISDPHHDEHEAMLEWCGGAFDPYAFDLDAVNADLAQIRL